jgi:hypothetical protein
MSEYTHLELDRDVAAPAGYYTPKKEVRIRIDGREVLYVVSQAVIDASCCGVADFASALVPGYIVKWRAGTDSQPVSEVAPIEDEHVRELVRHTIHNNENIDQVEFW